MSSLIEKSNRTIPDYYNTMYLDGYSPQEIYIAARRSLINQYNANQYESKIEEEIYNIIENVIKDIIDKLDWYN